MFLQFWAETVEIIALRVWTESTNNQKLMLEYEKFQELQAKSQRMQEDYDHQLTEMEEKRESALQEMTVYYENKLQDLSAKLEQVLCTVYRIKRL